MPLNQKLWPKTRDLCMMLVVRWAPLLLCTTAGAICMWTTPQMLESALLMMLVRGVDGMLSEWRVSHFWGTEAAREGGETESKVSGGDWIPVVPDVIVLVSVAAGGGGGVGSRDADDGAGDAGRAMGGTVLLS